MSTGNMDERYWIQERRWEPYLAHWVMDLVYSTDSGQSRDSPLPPGTPDWQFAVYLDEDYGIQWFFRNLNPNTVHDSNKWFCERFGDIHAQTVHLQILSESMRQVSQQALETKNAPPQDIMAVWEGCIGFRKAQVELRAIRWMVAEAFSHAFDNTVTVVTGADPSTDPRYVMALKALEVARSHLNARSAEKGRARLFFGAFVGLVVTLVSFIVLNYLFSQSPDGRKVALEETNQVSMARIIAGTNPPAAPALTKAASDHSASPPGTAALALTEPEPEVPCAWWHGWMTESGWEVLRIAHLGSLGAMLSLLLLASDRTYDAGTMHWVHRVEGACRVAVGVIGALFVLLVMKSGLIGSVFLKGDGPQSSGWIQAVLAILAGFSEKLVPNFATILSAQALPPSPTAPPAPSAGSVNNR